MSRSAWKQQLVHAVRPGSFATLTSQGISQGELRSRRWRRVSRGFYVPASAGQLTIKSDRPDRPDSVRLSTAQRILDVTPLLAPGTALGTWAAAFVLGVDWLDGLDPHTMSEQKLDLVSPGVRRRSTASITYRWSRLTAGEITVRDGVCVTCGARTAFDGARWAACLEEAVVFVDSMVAFDAVALPELQTYASAHPAWLGVEQALRASEIARPGVRSGWETRLRMCWRFDAGLPDPLVNVPIFDLFGQLLGIADLFDPDSGLVAEFDGDQHRNTDQHRKDNIREEKFESANLVVVRSDKTDVRRYRRQLVGRLQDGYRRGQLRDRRQDTWTLRQPSWWQRQRSSVWIR